MALDDGGAQIDPATLPENVELIQEIEALSTQQRAPSVEAPAYGPMRDLLVEALHLTATGLAAALSERHASHPLEEDLRGGLAAALSGSDAIVFTEARLRLSGWTPNLGGFDVAVVGTDGSLALIETKWGQVWQAMWDVLKLASARQHPRVTAAYAVYAASARDWSRYPGGSELFGDWDSRQFATDSLIVDNQQEWEWNLKESTVYPSELPGAVGLERVARKSITLLGNDYEIRAISVAAETAKPVELERGRLAAA